MNPQISTEMIQQLAAAISLHLSPEIPLSVDLWDAKHAASYFKCSASNFLERYAPLPGFPRPVRLPSQTERGKHPRWKARDVINWAESHQEPEPGGRRG